MPRTWILFLGPQSLSETVQIFTEYINRSSMALKAIGCLHLPKLSSYQQSPSCDWGLHDSRSDDRRY